MKISKISPDLRFPNLDFFIFTARFVLILESVTRSFYSVALRLNKIMWSRTRFLLKIAKPSNSIRVEKMTLEQRLVAGVGDFFLALSFVPKRLISQSQTLFSRFIRPKPPEKRYRDHYRKCAFTFDRDLRVSKTNSSQRGHF